MFKIYFKNTFFLTTKSEEVAKSWESKGYLVVRS